MAITSTIVEILCGHTHWNLFVYCHGPSTIVEIIYCLTPADADKTTIQLSTIVEIMLGFTPLR